MNVTIEFGEVSVMVDAGYDSDGDLDYDVLATECYDENGINIELDYEEFKAEFHEQLQPLIEAAMQAECERQEVARLDHESEMRSYARTNGGW